MTAPHRGIVASLLAVVLGLSGACQNGGGNGEGDDATGAGSTTTSNPTDTATSTAPSDGIIGPTTATTAQVVTVVVSAGKVEGGFRRERVPAGRPLVLRILSDTADEVRVEGYDIAEDVPAGGTARLTFTPDRPGVFMVELVESRLELLELEVT